MDTPVLISHKTAWLVHHAPRNLVQAVAQRDYQIGVRGLSTQQRIARIRQALTDCGIPSTMLKTIDISVVFAFERIRTNGVTCHVLGQNLPYDHIDELTPGIFITDEAFTFVLAAEWMDRIEYLEYGYEVCGDYRMGLNPSDPYTEQPATTSKDEIVELLDRTLANPAPHAPDSRSDTSTTTQPRPWRPHRPSPSRSQQAKAALASEVSNSTNRSKSLNVSGIAQKPDRSKSTLLLLISAENSASNIRAVFTTRPSAKGADAEREAVLVQMGYRIVTLTSAQFASQLAFHRAMNSIREALGMPRCTDAEYQRKQNELRKALIRNWKSAQGEDTPSE